MVGGGKPLPSQTHQRANWLPLIRNSSTPTAGQQDQLANKPSRLYPRNSQVQRLQSPAIIPPPPRVAEGARYTGLQVGPQGWDLPLARDVVSRGLGRPATDARSPSPFLTEPRPAPHRPGGDRRPTRLCPRSASPASHRLRNGSTNTHNRLRDLFIDTQTGWRDSWCAGWRDVHAPGGDGGESPPPDLKISGAN